MCLSTGTPKTINFTFESNGKLMDSRYPNSIIITGAPETINFPFVPNGKLMDLGAQLFKLIRVFSFSMSPSLGSYMMEKFHCPSSASIINRVSLHTAFYPPIIQLYNGSSSPPFIFKICHCHCRLCTFRPRSGHVRCQLLHHWVRWFSPVSLVFAHL